MFQSLHHIQEAALFVILRGWLSVFVDILTELAYGFVLIKGASKKYMGIMPLVMFFCRLGCGNAQFERDEGHKCLLEVR